MGGGGPTNQQSTTTQNIPAWALPYAQQLLGQAGNLVLPGGQLQQMPSNLNQQVAGFTPFQNQAFGDIGNTTGQSGDLAGAGAQNLGATLSGQFLDPSSNPYLQKTYNMAAENLTNEYNLGTAPSLQAEGLQASGGGGPGALQGSSAFNEAQSANQFGLGENLGNLATQIYGGNYQQERQNQISGLGLLPQTQNSLYQPAQELLGAGSLQQQQQQTGLDTTFQNALRAFQFPQQNLSFLGNILGQATQGGGKSVSISPNPGQTK